MESKPESFESSDRGDALEGSKGLDRRLLLGAAGLVGMAALSRMAHAGPLDPPAGPIGSTSPGESGTAINDTSTPGDGSNYRYRITQPGNYYLTGPISTNFARAIQIEADNVSIDLRGFTITNTLSGFYGILVSGVRTNLSIRNGTISVSGTGIVVGLSDELDGLFLKDMFFLCYGSNANGVSYYVRRLRAENCHFIGSGAAISGYGLNLWGGGVILGCTARNLGYGFYVNGGSALVDCAVRNCNVGFYVNGCTLQGCVSVSSVSHGFTLTGTSVAEGCVSFGSGGNGFYLSISPNTQLINCVATGNTQNGVQSAGASESLIIRGCSLSRNTLSGLQTDTGCAGSHIEGNVMRRNALHGAFLAGPEGTTVRGNTITGNTQHGLWLGGLTDGSVVENNTIRGNATAGAYDGLRVEANDVVIRGNNISGHTTVGAVGYRLTASRNTFVSNFVSNNTTTGSANVANHVFGPVVTGLGTVSSTNPWANFQN